MRMHAVLLGVLVVLQMCPRLIRDPSKILTCRTLVLILIFFVLIPMLLLPVVIISVITSTVTIIFVISCNHYIIT